MCRVVICLSRVSIVIIVIIIIIKPDLGGEVVGSGQVAVNCIMLSYHIILTHITIVLFDLQYIILGYTSRT